MLKIHKSDRLLENNRSFIERQGEKGDSIFSYFSDYVVLTYVEVYTNVLLSK